MVWILTVNPTASFAWMKAAQNRSLSGGDGSRATSVHLNAMSQGDREDAVVWIDEALKVKAK
jgi:hypothetical protein